LIRGFTVVKVREGLARLFDPAHVDRHPGDLRGGQRCIVEIAPPDPGIAAVLGPNLGGRIMMNDMMGWMMGGMGFVWFLVVIVLVLLLAALVKYVFFR
jgi:hypothetical protein